MFTGRRGIEPWGCGVRKDFRRSRRKAGERRAGPVARRAVPVVGALLALVSGAFVAHAATVPPFPPLPPIHIHLPKAQQTADFELVIEGKATSEVISRLEGKDSVCLYNEAGTLKDLTTYRRGRGVVVQFDRYGSELLIHRAGRETDASVAISADTVRNADGESHAVPYTNLACSVPTIDLSKTPDCGTHFTAPGDVILEYEQSSLRMVQGRASALNGGATNIEDKCGHDPQTGVASNLLKAFPSSPKLEPGRLTLHQIFGHAHVLVVKLLSSDRHISAEEKRKVTAGTFKGTETERAFNEATVRLIRKKHG